MVGFQAGYSLNNGNFNVALGNNAGLNVTSGSYNIAIGPSTGATYPTSGSSDILIGQAINAPGAATANYMEIGNGTGGLAMDMTKGILIWIGPTTTIGTCGTSPALAAGSNDMVGEATVGTSSSNSCKVSFANTHTAAPFCTVTSQAGATVPGFGYTISTTALTVTSTSGLDSSKFDYHCFAGSTSANPTP